MPSFFSKEYITAKASYNRWLVPPAALAIHLSIGMAYGFSVFWKPLGNALIGQDGKALAACSAGAATFADKLHGTLRALTATDCNWTQFDLGWMYTLFFVLLGSSAATWASVSRIPCSATCFSSAAKRCLNEARSLRSQIERTPDGETKMPR